MTNEQAGDKVISAFFTEMKRERRSRYIRSILSFVIFALIFAPGVGKLFFDEKVSGNYIEYQTINLGAVTSKKSALIAVLPIQGLITGDSIGTKPAKSILGSSPENMVSYVRNALIEMEKEKELTTLILFIDSPGGTVIASDDLYRMILRWKAKTGVRVIAYFNSIATSGGYYIAQAADVIAANENTLTGSIGVIMGTMNFSELAKKLGIRSEVIKTGPYKDIGSQWRNMNENERKLLQSLVQDSYQKFIKVIVDGRKNVLTEKQILTLADGRIYSGRQAKALGLVDAIADFEVVIKAENVILEALNLYNGSSVVIYHAKKMGFWEDLLKSYLPQTNIPFINNSPEFSRPQMMYIWPGAVQ